MPVVADTEEEAASAEGVGPKERIFHAAMSIAVRKGFGKVALSLVAREAGLSKGGLLHHFATKNDLIRAMLEFYADPAIRDTPPVHLGEANASASNLDPFAVAVLIAAAENPLLLEVVRTQLASEAADAPDRSETMPGHLRLVGDLVAKFDPAAPAHERRAGNTAFVVRHRADEKLLGLFVAQHLDALWDMVDEFSNPAEYEYRPVVDGALTLSKHEMDVDASSVPSRPGFFECSWEMSGGLTDIVTAKGDWTPFHAADEGSGAIARTLDQLRELGQASFEASTKR